MISSPLPIGKVHEADAKWCREHDQDYLPVVFPGFSWRNLSKMRGVDAPLNAIPRLGGEFLWNQASKRIAGGGRVRKFVFRVFGYVLVWGCFFD